MHKIIHILIYFINLHRRESASFRGFLSLFRSGLNYQQQRKKRSLNSYSVAPPLTRVKNHSPEELARRVRRSRINTLISTAAEK